MWLSCVNGREHCDQYFSFVRVGFKLFAEFSCAIGYLSFEFSNSSADQVLRSLIYWKS